MRVVGGQCCAPLGGAGSPQPTEPRGRLGGAGSPQPTEPRGRLGGAGSPQPAGTAHSRIRRRGASTGGLAILLALVLSTPHVRAQNITDEQVQAAIERYKRDLIEKQAQDGTWQYPGYPMGGTALVLMALKQAGVPNDHQAVRNAVRALVEKSDERTYSEALAICALEMVDPRAHRRRIETAAQFLIKTQQDHGGWGYGPYGGGDSSNSQFGVLGLAAAERCGIEIPEKVRKKALAYWRETQNRDGGWGYRAGAESTFNMTCAGIASATLFGVSYEKNGRQCGEYLYNNRLSAGFKWLSKQFAQGDPRFLGHWGHYGLYAIERVAIFLDMKSIGNLDWYRWGAGILLGEGNMQLQARDPITGDAFGLLFLAKAATPIAIAKWKWAGDWNNDHDDVRNWVAGTGTLIEKRLDWVPAELDGPDSPAAKASLVFVNGHDRFTLQPREEAFLRAFLEEKGTVVAEPCCDSRRFAESFTAEIVSNLYPNGGARFEPIPASHAIYTAFYRLDPREHRILQLRESGCRKKRLFLLTHDISCALNGEKEGAEKTSAERVAANLLTYAMKARAPKGKLNREELPEVEAQATNLAADEVKRKHALTGSQFAQPFGRLKHRGDWLADPAFFDALQVALKTTDDVPRFDAEVYIDPNSDGLFQVPVLFMNGHNNPALTDAEWLNLRSYLQNGGFLFASACCSSEEFDKGFRQLVANMFPNDKLERIAVDDDLYSAPVPLADENVVGTEAYNDVYKGRWAELYGVRRAGRWVLVYTPTDICCALEDDLEEDTSAYKQEHALKLILNVLAYPMRL